MLGEIILIPNDIFFLGKYEYREPVRLVNTAFLELHRCGYRSDDYGATFRDKGEKGFGKNYLEGVEETYKGR